MDSVRSARRFSANGVGILHLPALVSTHLSFPIKSRNSRKCISKRTCPREAAQFRIKTETKKSSSRRLQTSATNSRTWLKLTTQRWSVQSKPENCSTPKPLDLDLQRDSTVSGEGRRYLTVHRILVSKEALALVSTQPTPRRSETTNSAPSDPHWRTSGAVVEQRSELKREES